MTTMSISGRTCFYRDIGSGYPVLFGHSYLWTSAMWDPQLTVLSEKFRCIVPDLWDHGQSGHLNAAQMTLEQIADDYWTLMERLGISEFAIVGLSIGGMWGTQLALQHPEAVKAIVLMDTFVGSEPQENQKKYYALIDILEKERRFTSSFLDHAVPLFFSPKTLSHNPQLVKNFRASLVSTPEDSIPGIISIGKAIFSRNCLLSKLPSLT